VVFKKLKIQLTRLGEFFKIYLKKKPVLDYYKKNSNIHPHIGGYPPNTHKVSQKKILIKNQVYFYA
jgi:hypothetical protein